MKLKFDIKDIMSRSFDLINLPSEGKYYENNVSSLKIRHLTGLEEMLLTSYFLNESGDALALVLDNVILDEFDTKKLILPDLQGIMIFLYATAFGDKLKFNVKCPVCNYEDETPVQLSSLDFKKQKIKPDNGKFYLYIFYEDFFSKYGFKSVEENENRFLEIVIKPPTFGEQLESKKRGIDLSNATNKAIMSIISIGEIEDRDIISKFIKSLKLPYFKKIKEFIKDNEVGIEEKFKTVCPACGSENSYHLSLGHDFLKLPESHKQNVLEECFLLSHYSLGTMSFDKVKELPTAERRWAINRLQEELQKKQDAEKKAYDAAKSKSGGKKR